MTKKNFLKYIISFLSVFLFLEIVLNFIYYFERGRFFHSYHLNKDNTFQQFTLHGLYKFNPNVTAHMPGYPDNLSTNKYGFVSNDNFKHNLLDNEKYNIFMLGGSTVEGRGASSNKNTISSILERCLLKHNNNIQVINAGFSGDFSYQEFLRFAGDIIPNYKVDYVISLTGRNDAHYVFIENSDWKINHNPSFSTFTNQINNQNSDCISCAITEKLSRFSLLYYGMEYYIYKFKLINDKYKKYSFSKRYSKENFNVEQLSVNLIKAKNTFLNNLNLMKVYANSYNIGFKAYIQPILDSSTKKNMTSNEISFLTSYAEEYGDKYFDHINEFFEKIRSENKPYIQDYSSLFLNQKDELFYDSVHYNDLGNKILANKICNNIKTIF